MNGIDVDGIAMGRVLREHVGVNHIDVNVIGVNGIEVNIVGAT